MANIKKVIIGLEHCADRRFCNDICPYSDIIRDQNRGMDECISALAKDALELLKEQEKEIKALRLLVEWAEECDFGFDQFPDEYERYKEEIKDMNYIDGMIHVAKRTLEDK